MKKRLLFPLLIFFIISCGGVNTGEIKQTELGSGTDENQDTSSAGNSVKVVETSSGVGDKIKQIESSLLKDNKDNENKKDVSGKGEKNKNVIDIKKLKKGNLKPLSLLGEYSKQNYYYIKAYVLDQNDCYCPPGAYCEICSTSIYISSLPSKPAISVGTDIADYQLGKKYGLIISYNPELAAHWHDLYNHRILSLSNFIKKQENKELHSVKFLKIDNLQDEDISKLDFDIIKLKLKENKEYILQVYYEEGEFQEIVSYIEI